MKRPLCLLVLPLLLASTLLRADDSTPPALTANPGFENDMAGWSFGTAPDSKDKNAQGTASTDSPHAGAKCALLKSDDFARFSLAPNGLAVKPGEKYRVTAWMRAGADAEARAGEPGFLIRLTLSNNKADAPGGHMYVDAKSQVTHGNAPTTHDPLPTTWTQIQAVVQIPPDCDYMGPAFFSWYAKGSIYVDDMSVELVDPATAVTPVTDSSAATASNSPQVKGPIATDAETIADLNLDAPGMEKVKAAVQGGNLPAIQAAYLDYRRTASPAKFRIMPKDQPATATATSDVNGDLVCAHNIHNWFYGFAPKDGVDMGKDFRWSYNPIPKTDPSYTEEWTWCAISRTQFWQFLADAYWRTRDEKYAKEWVAQMEDFAAKNPLYHEQKGASSLWRTLDASERMDNSWPYCYYHFLNSPSFTPEANWIYLRSVRDHATLLSNGLKNQDRTGNWVASECFGLFSLATYFPELKDAADFRKIAIDRLVVEANRAVPPDGMEAELTPGYHSFTLSSFTGPLAVAKLNNIQLPDIFEQKIIAMYKALVITMDQGGTDVPTNDSNIVNAASMAREALKIVDDPVLKWAATKGKEGTPLPNSTMLPYAGFYAMRAGWKLQDLYLFFRAGPTGIGHEHEDMLEVVLKAGGQTLLFDPGSYVYDHSDWRRFTIGTPSHSTIIVDGKWQHRGASKLPAPLLNNPWAITPLFNYVAGTYDGGYQQSEYNPNAGYSPQKWIGTPDKSVTHTRRVLFLPPYYALVVDTLDGTGHHTFDSHFQMEAKSAKVDPSTQAVTSNTATTMNLSLYPLELDHLKTEVVQGQQQPLLGWMPHDHRPIPTARFRKEQDAPAIFATFLYPFSGTAPVFQAKPLAVTGDGIWSRALTTQEEKAEIALVKDGKPKALTFTSALGGKVQATATGLVLRDPLKSKDLFGGGWDLTAYSDAKTAFTLEAPATLAWVVRDGAVLIYNGGTDSATITLTKPLAQKVTLAPGTWTDVSKPGGTPAAAPDLFPPPKMVSNLPTYESYLKIQPTVAPSATAVPIVLEAEKMTLPTGAVIVEKTGARGQCISNWDQSGTALSTTIKVPQAGWYHLRVRFCSGDDPIRSVLINGKIPFQEAGNIEFGNTATDATGSTGWSRSTDDFRDLIPGAPTLPEGWKFFLPKGDVEVGLRNEGGGGANIDWLQWEPVK